jgi:hypothetical protein
MKSEMRVSTRAVSRALLLAAVCATPSCSEHAMGSSPTQNAGAGPAGSGGSSDAEAGSGGKPSSVSAGASAAGSAGMARAGERSAAGAGAAGPPGAGTIVGVEWDFEGAGDYPMVEKLPNTTSDHVELETTYTFANPGTYFPAVRVSAHRNGDANTPYARIPNLDRVRVVVK